MSFGHTLFGAEPFGHSLSVKIEDTSYNPLANGSTAQMLGYTEPSEVPTEQEALNLDIYRFILEGIREQDKKNHLFLQRYLQGPQDVWATIQAKIFAIKDLWDVTTINDEHLQYLKRIVGWSKDTDSITDSLDYSALRKLIAGSVALWKKRGTEGAFRDIIYLATDARLRTYNWFDYRWIVDETIVGEDHQGLDSWMIGNPEGSEKSEYISSLRIVDDGNLDKDLVVDLVKLMRAVSERWEINYITFLDRFLSDSDDTQWTYFSNTLTVSNGTAKLETTASRQLAVVTTTESWSNYVVYSRIRGTCTTSAGMFGIVVYSDGTEDNCYTVSFSVLTNEILVHKIVSGIKTQIASYNYLSLGTLADNIWYGLRVQISPDTVGSLTNRIKVYIDSKEILNFTDATFSSGTVGIWHETNATVEVDEVEMFTLPMDSDYVDINS